MIESDRRYCHDVLPRVSRTFALNIRLLDGSLGESVRLAYLWCRSADALEDSWPGDPTAIEERFELLIAAVEGEAEAAGELARRAGALETGRPDLELLAHLPRLGRAFAALPAADREPVVACVRTLSHGMARYAMRAAAPARQGAPYLDSEDELHDYCWVVAGCVGEMLTCLFARRATDRNPTLERRRRELAPVVGEALQLTNILLDWPIDVRRGRCYLPAAWLGELDLAPTELVEAARPGVGEIAARLETLARNALARVPDYLDTIPSRHVRYRLFCLWPALWALGSLRHARRDPEFPWGIRRPRLPRAELWGSALGSVIAAHHGGLMRRLYAASG